MNRTEKIKEAFKTALAMTLAYGIALALNWDAPKSAAYSVAVIGMVSTGQSVLKGGMRMLGTLLAFVASLSLIAAFPQHRWGFLAAHSVYIAGCTYIISRSKLPYFWFCAAYVTAVICMEAGPDPVGAFETAVVRTQPTGLGLLVYTLVSITVLPRTIIGEFLESTRDLVSMHRRYCRAYFDQLIGKDDKGEFDELKMYGVHEQSMFDKLLTEAESESYEVRNRRRQWRRFRNQSAALLETMERLRDNLHEIKHLDLNSLRARLESRSNQFEQRFAHQCNLIVMGPGGYGSVSSSIVQCLMECLLCHQDHTKE